MMQEGFCPIIAIRGAGDLGTGVALELWRAGLRRLVLLECARPRAIRRLVAFSEAVFDGTARVEGCEARLCADTAACRALWPRTESARAPLPVLPLLVDERGSALAGLAPQILVDATMRKKGGGLSRDLAELVIALGPGHEAGQDVHCVIESFGPAMGSCIWQGAALPSTGIPCEHGRHEQRVAHAPCAGEFCSALALGQRVRQGQEVGRVDGTPVQAPLTGRLRGLLRSGLTVRAGTKVCDIEPLDHVPLDRVAERARCLGRGVLRAIAARYNHPF